jgi:hypothetical protein
VQRTVWESSVGLKMWNLYLLIADKLRILPHKSLLLFLAPSLPVRLFDLGVVDLCLESPFKVCVDDWWEWTEVDLFLSLNEEPPTEETEFLLGALAELSLWLRVKVLPKDYFEFKCFYLEELSLPLLAEP